LFGRDPHHKGKGNANGNAAGGAGKLSQLFG
jgi:hypothetical protein